MTLQRKRVHENYHKKTRSQYKIIKDKNFTYRHLLAGIKEYLKPGMKVLDIGCGAGALDFYFAAKGFDVTGVDISPSAINSCIETSKNLGLKNVIFKILDFPNEILNKKFDFIIMTEVIEHLENDKIALDKINSMLNQNGILFLTTPLQDAPLNRMGLTRKFDKDVGHLRRYKETELSKILVDYGFKILKINKTEGIIRNFLFVNSFAGRSIRFIKFSLSDLITGIDNISQHILGYSNIIIVAKKGIDK